MEVKKPIFKRVPPGDRWVEIDGNPDRIFPTLTDTLEHYFQKTGNRQYYFDAAKGMVYKVETAPDPEPIIPKYSIYDDSSY